MKRTLHFLHLPKWGLRDEYPSDTKKYIFQCKINNSVPMYLIRDYF